MAEKEYIERNALIAEYDRVHIGTPGGARKLMVEAPTADVVEVVRCKDCKYRRVSRRCALWCGSLDEKEYFLERGEDFYCAYGERKDT